MRKMFQNMKTSARLAFFVLFIGVATVLASAITTPILKASNMETAQVILCVQGLSQIIMFLCPALLFAWLFSDKVGVFFQTGLKRWQLYPILLATLLIIIAIPLVDVLSSWNESLHLPQSLAKFEDLIRLTEKKSQELVSQFLSLPGLGNLLLNLLILALIPAICEELVFRGVIQKTLVDWFRNPHVAIMVTAAVFSLTHFEIFQFVPRFVLGVFLGYIFYYSHTIWASALAHFTNNALIVVLSYAQKYNIINIDPQNIQLPYPAIFAIASTELSAVILFFMMKTCKKHTQILKKE